MRFGLFGSAEARRDGETPGRAAGFRDFVETNVQAEALGYHSSFLVEHHFGGIGQVSDSLGLMSWVAAATRTLRVGTAVVVLPWHDPVILAEKAATLDLMSGGRLDFGVGRGYRHSEFTGFCMPMEEATARFEEAYGVIVRAWTSEVRFSHRGRFWRYEDILVEPPPAQKPHPPLWIAAGNPDSIARVARLGANLLLDQFASPTLVGERIAHFKAGVEAAGRTFDPMSVAVARNVFVAESKAEMEDAMARQRRAHANLVRLSARPDGTNRSHIMQYADDAGGTEANALYGMPDEVIAGLETLRALGVRQVLVNGGGQQRLVVRRFAKHVMPVLVEGESLALAVAHRSPS